MPLSRWMPHPSANGTASTVALTLARRRRLLLRKDSEGLETAEEDKKASKKVQKKIAKRQDGQAARTSSGTVCWWKVACLHFISTWPMWLG
ncbi:hypothetical protein CY35_01G186600 [Sphagnum magellanicum]|nr:hypothetical protein CY35_01G186600 [Sphagnum magellanicum]